MWWCHYINKPPPPPPPTRWNPSMQLLSIVQFRYCTCTCTCMYTVMCWHYEFMLMLSLSKPAPPSENAASWDAPSDDGAWHAPSWYASPGNDATTRNERWDTFWRALLSSLYMWTLFFGGWLDSTVLLAYSCPSIHVHVSWRYFCWLCCDPSLSTCLTIAQQPSSKPLS